MSQFPGMVPEESEFSTECPYCQRDKSIREKICKGCANTLWIEYLLKQAGIDAKFEIESAAVMVQKDVEIVKKAVALSGIPIIDELEDYPKPSHNLPGMAIWVACGCIWYE